jgi:adenylate kinase family enzyme
MKKMVISPPALKSFPYQRIGVVGTTGSGKSTLAGDLANILNILHIELDSLHWKPNWQEAPRDLTRQKVKLLTRNETFVVDGNYGFLRDIIWPRLQAVVWLDYPLPVILWQLLRRTLKRTLTRKRLWGTNVERFLPQFFSRDSLFLWALQTYQKNKILYKGLFSSPEHGHIRVFHFRNPKETRDWLMRLSADRWD